MESRYNSTHKGTMYQPSYKTFKQAHSGHRNTKNHKKQSNKHYAKAKACKLKSSNQPTELGTCRKSNGKQKVCNLKFHKLHKSQSTNAKARNKASSKTKHRQKPRASHKAKASSKTKHSKKPRASHKAKASHNSTRGQGLQMQAPHSRKGGRKAKHKTRRT